MLKEPFMDTTFEEYAYTGPDRLPEYHPCRACKQMKPRDGFYKASPRVCKPCYKARQASRIKAARSSSSSSTDPVDPSDASSSGADLYVISNPRVSETEFKVGRAADVQARIRQLEACQSFRMRLHATFSGAGHAEQEVHRRLAYCRVATGNGREWFSERLPVILLQIGEALGS